MNRPPSTPESTRKRVIAASFVGTTIEWYDFFIYGTAAALIFGDYFFSTLSPLSGTLAAFGTYAVGFVARPVGGIVAGHFGDRIGRKSMLVVSLLVMGVATAAVGVLPGYATIGIWAPILLVALRFAQGLGVGGEWGGAVLMVTEHAPRGRRGLYGSFPQMGLPAGIILSNLVFLAVTAAVSPEAFAAWGWRVPFLFGGLLVLFGLFIRLRVEESPEFRRLQVSTEVSRSPVVEVLRGNSRFVLLGAGAAIAAPVLGYVVIVYMLAYGTTVLELSRTTILGLILIGSVAWLLAILAAGSLSDRFGRRTVYAFGAAMGAVWAFPFYWLSDTGSPVLVGLAIVVASVATGVMSAPQAALVAEIFPTRVRYSGASLVYQLGAIIGGALAPIIATALYGRYLSSTPISIYLLGACLVSLVSIAFLPETLADDEGGDAAPAAGFGSVRQNTDARAAEQP